MSKSSDHGGGSGSVYALVLVRAHKEMLARGVAAEALLEHTGLDDSALLDPYSIIDRRQAVQYYRNLVKLSPCPGIGLEIGLKARLSDYGSSGFLTLTTADTADAISSAHKVYGLQYLHVDWVTDITDDAIIHRGFVDQSLRDLEVFLLERAFTVLQSNSQELIGPECFPDKLMLAYPDPGYAERYRQIFHCPVEFDSGVNEVRYPAHYLEFRIPTHDPAVNEVLESISNMLIQKLSGDGGVVSAVRLALRERPGVFPSIEAVAERLGMSSRSLSRKLRENNTNFQSLLDEARHAVAEDRLLHSKLSIQQIAEACGFRDAQNFAQAFKRWNGLSPSEFRRLRSKQGH